MKNKNHSFNIWSWEQEPKEVLYLQDDGKYAGYVPNYFMFKNKVFKYKKFGKYLMKKYKITVEEVK